MIFYKTIEAEDILLSLASLIGSNLPKELKDSEYGLSLEFSDDHSVEVYLVPSEEEDNNTN